MGKNLFLAASALTVLLVAVDAAADGYRCGRKLVRTGDPVSKLVEVCGQPVHRGSGRESVLVDGRRKEVTVQEWHYRMGSRRLGRVVRVYRGRIVAIEVARR